MPLSRLERGDLTVVTRGVRVVTPPASLQARAAAFAAAMRREDHAFSHVTAAILWGLPLPTRVEGQSDLDVVWSTRRGRVRRDGCIGHRGLESRAVSDHLGLRVTAPADTWCDLGEVLRRGLTRDDLVVAGDAVANLLGTDPEAEPVHLMAESLHRRVRPRGKVMLTEALALVRPGVRSPMETRTRLMFHRASLPEPELNVPVMFEEGGWMLEGDFVWRRQRVIGEYQGAHHATIRQRGVDHSRRLLAEDDGWTFLELFADDVFTRSRRIATLTRLGATLGVPAGDLHLW
ncbi:hypothetical protein N801_07415 [Knoellia aerolata DSM 18566]|uniref:DUF559 domain-containing protein n=1 Tax=Knoellia aerolata DSM 18566 TaxID=1385519 RepID=A0A0A0JXD1_9MICO|nr:hypothetical protein N801_07415 [Knoellia aerolata DSM 18566]